MLYDNSLLSHVAHDRGIRVACNKERGQLVTKSVPYRFDDVKTGFSAGQAEI